MKIAVIGSRSFSDNDLMIKTLKELNPTIIISGGAEGADRLAHIYATVHKIEYKEFLPDWKAHGKPAGIIRNRLIVDNSELVIAFWDGQSKGTKFSIDYAKKKGVEVLIVYYENH